MLGVPNFRVEYRHSFSLFPGSFSLSFLLHLKLLDLGNMDCERVVMQYRIFFDSFYLQVVWCASNRLGSPGAYDIPKYLATNPGIKILYLDDNLSNGEDAILFPNPLRINWNL